MTFLLAAVARVAPAILLMTGPAMAAGIDWSQAKQVDEITRDDVFVPNRLVFTSGVVYRLHLVNQGKDTHEFHAPRFFAAVELRNPAILNADRTEIVLQPGDRKDLYFVAKKPGQYPLTCPDHDWDGMTGEITIK